MKLLTYLIYVLLFATVLSCGAPVNNDKSIDTLQVQPDSIIKTTDTLVATQDTIVINDTI